MPIAAPRPRTWKLPDDAPPTDECARLAGVLGVSPLIAELLWRRGLTDSTAMDVFLSPNLRHLAAPGEYPGFAQAAEALAQGLTEGLPMAVWGDYDVDGVTATALVLDFLRQRGIDATHHIPDRINEGYGLNVPGVEALAARGVRLLMTVDNGITATEAVARARELGMRVVVTDHHLPGAEAPVAHAVANPRLDDCPCPHLAGVGVAFLVMAALNRLLPGEPLDMRPFLDLVALGTLADVVKLTGQNRILTKNGMLLIAEARRPGIFTLKEAAGYNPDAEMGAGQIVFGLAPRINAAGRLGKADLALKLLLAEDRTQARPLAVKLDAMNTERKREEERIADAALEQAQGQIDAHGEEELFGLVLHGADWHSGIIGIVASRVVERFHRPTLVLCTENGKLKGSGRSISEFDLHAGLSACADILAGFGGHRQAAGLSLDPARLGELVMRFDAVVREALGDVLPPPSMRVDAGLSFADIDHRLLKELALLQPFGMGNPEPVFHHRATVREHRVFGANHVNLALTDAGGVSLQAKAWRQAETLGPDLVGNSVRLAFCPKINTFGGLASIELHLKDLQHDQ